MKVLLLILSTLYIFPQPKITVYLVGDSTMSIKQEKYYPETGWGMPFVHFFDSSVTVENHAQNGRSTKSFLNEKRWDPIVGNLKEGDYVFIQFGHNDEIQTKKNATKPDEFRNNLKKYVSETLSKKAHPILITAVARRSFTPEGSLTDTHEQYSNIVRALAKEMQVPLIDLDAKSRELLLKMGPEISRLLYLHLQPGEHPNYPEGKTDDTHFSELGARMMAQLVLKEMKELNLGLLSHVKNYAPESSAQ